MNSTSASSTSQTFDAVQRSAPRTAVVVVHGIGDQRPMETLNGVVEAVLGETGNSSSIRRWAKPYVGSDGSFDLRSVTTEAVGPSARRYDFFEFYWAHLMSGTRFVAVLLWLGDIAKRDRHQLPPGTGWLWHLIVTLLVVALMASVHLLWAVGLTWVGTDPVELAGRADGAAVPAAVFFLAVGVLVSAFAVFGLRSGVPQGLAILAVFLVLGAVAWWRGVALFTIVPVIVGLIVFLGVRAALFGMAWVAALVVFIATSGWLLSLVGIGSAARPEFRWEDVFDVIFLTIQFRPAAVWLIGFLAVFSALAAIFLVPYVGDAARYLRDAPDNIEARNRIRALGLAILQDLHAQTGRDGSSPRYDRIVIVAHSLGSIIAYDVLRAFFVEQMAKVPVSPELADGLRPIDELPEAAVAAIDITARPEAGGLVWRTLTEVPSGRMSPLDYQNMQKRAFDAVAAHARAPDSKASAGAPWRISDIVTVGCPLTHAALLMTNGGRDEELEGKVTSREFPVAPPVRAEGERGRVLFGGGRPGSSPGALKIQHSALFAITRWTNLYFVQKFVVRGDFIGGPISRPLSPATANVPLETTIRGGYFNHTDYWSVRPEGETARHVRALKLAVLGEDALIEIHDQRRNRVSGQDVSI